MASKKPIAIYDGVLEELRPGDDLGSTADTVQRTATTTLTIGMAVYLDGSESVDKAQANADGTSDVHGLAAEGITAATTGSIVTEGPLTLTTGEWDAIAGTTGGLTPSALYYLDPSTAGHITETAPTTAGQSVSEVGEAVSSTKLEVRIRRRVKLN